MATLFRFCHSPITMMTLTPKGFFSWNSTLRGEKHHAELIFNWMSEQGRITLNGKYYTVAKLGMLSGEWTLSDSSEVRVTAQKTSAFTRTLTLSGPSGDCTLEAQSTLGRSMTLRGNLGHATIAPNHLFSRKATVTGKLPDIETTCLAAWLTLLTWKRSSSNGGS
jgi:hypothetical protein